MKIFTIIRRIPVGMGEEILVIHESVKLKPKNYKSQKSKKAQFNLKRVKCRDYAMLIIVLLLLLL